MRHEGSTIMQMPDALCERGRSPQDSLKTIAGRASNSSAQEVVPVCSTKTDKIGEEELAEP